MYGVCSVYVSPCLAFTEITPSLCTLLGVSFPKYHLKSENKVKVENRLGQFPCWSSGGEISRNWPSACLDEGAHCPVVTAIADNLLHACSVSRSGLPFAEKS